MSSNTSDFSTRRLAGFYLFSFSVHMIFFVSKMFLIKSFIYNVHMQRTLPHRVWQSCWQQAIKGDYSVTKDRTVTASTFQYANAEPKHYSSIISLKQVVPSNLLCSLEKINYVVDMTCGDNRRIILCCPGIPPHFIDICASNAYCRNEEEKEEYVY